jgi:flagellar FliJ protein
MVKSERMQTVAGLAKDKENRAALTLADLRRQHEEQERRLAELRQFHGEYLVRLETLGREGIDIQQLRQYRRFNERLGEAVQQQQRLVDEARQRLDRQNLSWSDASARRRALDETVGRLRTEEGAQAARKEQREADDRSQHRSVQFPE